MTEEEMNKLADIIVYKLIEKQKEYDKSFIEELKQSSLQLEVHEKNDIKTTLEIELKSLEKLLIMLQDNEHYEGAAECRDRIKFLKSELKKLK
jgi:excinuclease UvrABC helicase subunit UvrB